MRFTNIKDLKYVTANNSHIDLLATCKEHGEIPMTLNLVDTEDLHTYIDEDGNETPLEEYCKTQAIALYVEPIVSQGQIESEFRQTRDSLLNTVVDHYQKLLVWETLTVEQQDKVRIYRQALLDSTTNWILPEELVL